MVIIGFPGIAEARVWWDSPGYRESAPLRARRITGDIILVSGAPDDYDPTGTAEALRRDLAA